MNSIFDPTDLTVVPPPQVIETLEFETIFQEMLVQFQKLEPEYTFLTEADPVVKLLQHMAYREMGQRERTNQVAQSNLLPFSTGADLDNLGAFYNIRRLQIAPARRDNNGDIVIPAVMESDDDFKYRIQQRRSSTAGGAAHYRYWAFQTDPRVKDVAVYSPDFPSNINMGGQVQVALLSKEPNGTPSQDLIDKVSAVVGRDDVKVLSDIVDVIPAVQKPFEVQANIKLYPNAPISAVADAMTRLQTEFDKAQGLGRDITLSWLTSKLSSDNVHSVQLIAPAQDVVVRPNEYPVMTSVVTAFAGYSDSEGFGVVELAEEKAQRAVNQLYVAYAIANKRTQAQIQSDLMETAPVGVIAPTIRGLTVHLNLVGTKNPNTGAWLADDELCFLIWRNLSAQYGLVT
jgi:phage-related baseplate assembly protein